MLEDVLVICLCLAWNWRICPLMMGYRGLVWMEVILLASVWVRLVQVQRLLMIGVIGRRC